MASFALGHTVSRSARSARSARCAAALARAAAREHPAEAYELGYSLTGDEVENLCGGPTGGLTGTGEGARNPIAVSSYSQVFTPRGARLPAVFLWRETPDYGHWCAAWERAPGVLAVFDSYGVAPPDAWRQDTHLGYEELRELGQERTRILDYALSRDYSSVEWNDHPLQEAAPSVTTCGRWCALRLAFSELDPEEFAFACTHAADALGISLDDLVVRLTRYHSSQ